MSTDELSPDATKQNGSPDAQMQDSAATPTNPAAAQVTKKRPRLDLSSTGTDPRERKRGRGMFGLVLGTLNKAKVEDKERSASDAAKKRQMIESRLQAKLRKETDSVRRAEEAKKDKTSANRREEELQLKDSIYKLRRTRLPFLSNFLLTSDHIPASTDTTTPPPPSKNPLSEPPRTHPPPLYYLPATLTPAQEAFLTKKKVEVKDAANKEWEMFKEERAAGVEEIGILRKKVAEELERKKAEREEAGIAADGDKEMATPVDATGLTLSDKSKDVVTMEVDDTPQVAEAASNDGQASKEKDTVTETKDESAAMQADDDDAVEY